jgi:hypothetical protein
VTYGVWREAESENFINPVKKHRVNVTNGVGTTNVISAHQPGESIEALKCVNISKEYFPV